MILSALCGRILQRKYLYQYLHKSTPHLKKRTPQISQCSISSRTLGIEIKVFSYQYSEGKRRTPSHTYSLISPSGKSVYEYFCSYLMGAFVSSCIVSNPIASLHRNFQSWKGTSLNVMATIPISEINQ